MLTKSNYSKSKRSTRKARMCNLGRLSSFRIGGKARYFYDVVNLKALSHQLIAWEGPVYPLGRMSNVLIGENDALLNKGLVVHFGTDFNRLSYSKTRNLVYAEAGARLTSLVKFLLDHGLTDGIFLAGIPGTIGGAVRTNAGAFNKELGTHIKALKVMHRNGRCKWHQAAAFKFSYRETTGLADDDCVVAVMLQFNTGDVAAARSTMHHQLKQRRLKQPLEYANCGSVFRNPPGNFAAALIEQCGLKGLSCGNAEVSTKHANFIVNKGGATSSDVLTLIRKVQDEVKAKFNINLVLELKIPGLT